MPKYWGKQIFTHGRFPEVGQKQKTEREKKKRKRLNDGNNNGHAMHGARKPPGLKDEQTQLQEACAGSTPRHASKGEGCWMSFVQFI